MLPVPIFLSCQRGTVGFWRTGAGSQGSHPIALPMTKQSHLDGPLRGTMILEGKTSRRFYIPFAVQNTGQESLRRAMLPPGGPESPCRRVIPPSLLGPSTRTLQGRCWCGGVYSCPLQGRCGCGGVYSCPPLLKAPRSPLALAELQSLNCEARDSKSSSPDLIFWM